SEIIALRHIGLRQWRRAGAADQRAVGRDEPDRLRLRQYLDAPGEEFVQRGRGDLALELAWLIDAGGGRPRLDLLQHQIDRLQRARRPLRPHDAALRQLVLVTADRLLATLDDGASGR